MRGYGKSSYKFYTNCNVTNVTNVTHVTNVTLARGRGGSAWGKNGRHGFGKMRHGRPPKLLRFFASCGLLDSGVAARMSDGEMCGEAAKVVSYASRGLCQTAGDFVTQASSCVYGLAKCAGQVVGAVWSVFK